MMLPAVLHSSEHGFAPQHLGANEILLWFVIKSLGLNMRYSLSTSVQRFCFSGDDLDNIPK